MGVTRYTYGNRGELLAENRSGTESFYLMDGRGSASLLVDDIGSTTDSFEFSYYGETESRTGSTATPFQWLATRGMYTPIGPEIPFQFGNFAKDPVNDSSYMAPWDPTNGTTIGNFPRSFLPPIIVVCGSILPLHGLLLSLFFWTYKVPTACLSPCVVLSTRKFWAGLGLIKRL